MSFGESLGKARWIAAVALAVLGAPALAQDTYIESKTHTDAVKMMGREVPAQDGINRTWIGDGKIAVEDQAAGTTVIVRTDQKKMFIVNLKEKSYFESGLPFEFPPEMKQAMAAMKPEVTVTPTGESKVVSGFNTKLTKVNLKMMGQDIQMNYWVSKDVGVSTDQIQEWTQAMFAGNPMVDELSTKMASIDGYPVRVETTVNAMGSTFGSWQEVQKVEKKAAPAGTYEVPAGFKKTERMPTGNG